MKKLIIVLLFLGLAEQGFAQKDFNQWSLETNLGFNKSMGPLTPGYYSPTLNVGHVDFGLRYMINEKFGLKGDIGLGSFREASGTPSFNTNYQRINIQSVLNFGRILNFESFTDKFNFLIHFGTGFGRMKFEGTNFQGGEDEYHYNILSGVTGQYKISHRVALTGDISVIYNGRQTYTFDGNEYNAPVQLQPSQPGVNPLVHAPGTWWTGTLGLNFYLGKNEEHADWYLRQEKYATKDELNSQINEIKDMLKDSDGDGIPDYLDKEPNTPAEARVNSSGQTMDSDGDGTPDHLDECPFIPGPSSTSGCPVEDVRDEVDYFRKALNDGYVNVYFAFNSKEPLKYSSTSVSYVANFMKRNPEVSIEIAGYADELGPEDYNMKLSESRAKSVFDMLVLSGITPTRLTYKGYGEDSSVDKSSPEARQLARRSSFTVQ